MTSISLPSNIDITDAYEEIQVLHSFRVESADGKVSFRTKKGERERQHELVADQQPFSFADVLVLL